MSAVLSDTLLNQRAEDQTPAAIRAAKLIAEADAAADKLKWKYTAYHVGFLEGAVRRLCAELMPSETQHAKALRLLREARAITEGWLTHPVAGDDAASAHDAIADAIGAVEGVFFEQEKAGEES